MSEPSDDGSGKRRKVETHTEPPQTLEEAQRDSLERAGVRVRSPDFVAKAKESITIDIGEHIPTFFLVCSPSPR